MTINENCNLCKKAFFQFHEGLATEYVTNINQPSAGQFFYFIVPVITKKPLVVCVFRGYKMRTVTINELSSDQSEWYFCFINVRSPEIEESMSTKTSHKTCTTGRFRCTISFQINFKDEFDLALIWCESDFGKIW